MSEVKHEPISSDETDNSRLADAGNSVLEKLGAEETGGANEGEAALPYPEDPSQPTPFVPMVVPALLEISPELVPWVTSSTPDGRKLQEQMLPLMREGLFYELGVRFPKVRLRVDPSLRSLSFVFSLFDTPAAFGVLQPDEVLVGETPQRLELFRVSPRATVHPATRMPASWVHEKQLEKIEQLGLPFWRISDVLILEMAAAFREYAHEFIGIQEVRAMLDLLTPAFPDLVDAALTALTLPQIRRVLRRLVQERFSICNLRQILEILIDGAEEFGAETDKLSDTVRQRMHRHLCFRHAYFERQLIVHLLEVELEAQLLHHFCDVPLPKEINPYPVGNELTYDLLFSLREKFDKMPPGTVNPIVLTHAALRRPLQNLLKLEFPQVVVLAFEELDPHFQVQIVDSIPLPKSLL